MIDALKNRGIKFLIVLFARRARFQIAFGRRQTAIAYAFTLDAIARSAALTTTMQMFVAPVFHFSDLAA